MLPILIAEILMDNINMNVPRKNVYIYTLKTIKENELI